MKSIRKIGFSIVMLLLAFGVTSSYAQSSIKIHRYTEGDGIVGSVNSYLIESANGIVIVDAERVLSQGKKVAELAKQIGKPVLAILLTHPHPDHIGGLPAIAQAFPDAPIYGSQKTSDEIKNDPVGGFAATAKQYPDDFTLDIPLPNHIVADGDTFDIDGIHYVVDELDPSESSTMTLYSIPAENVLFAGDIVDNGMTGFMLEMRTEQWIQQLLVVNTTYGDKAPMVYQGHGLPAEFHAIVQDEIGHLTTMRYLISSDLSDGVLDPTERASVIATLKSLYPNEPPVASIPDLLDKNVDAVAQEITKEQAKS